MGDVTWIVTDGKATMWAGAWEETSDCVVSALTETSSPAKAEGSTGGPVWGTPQDTTLTTRCLYPGGDITEASPCQHDVGQERPGPEKVWKYLVKGYLVNL